MIELKIFVEPQSPVTTVIAGVSTVTDLLIEMLFQAAFCSFLGRMFRRDGNIVTLKMEEMFNVNNITQQTCTNVCDYVTPRNLSLFLSEDSTFVDLLICRCKLLHFK